MINITLGGLSRQSLSLLILFTSLILVSVSLRAQSVDHGSVKQQASGESVIWNAETESWTSFEQFWQQFTAVNDAKHWGKSTQYPEYSKVQEFDTFLVELPQGICLMQFFHSRWRRANDVQRWADEFNGFAGCPYVFD